MKTACPSCGATLPVGADRCDLCGTPVAAPDPAPEAPPAAPRVAPPAGAEEPAATPPPAVEAAPPPVHAAAPPADGPSYCIACGHPNPREARFCNRCGKPLPAPVAAAAPPQAPYGGASGATPVEAVAPRTVAAPGLPVGPAAVPPDEGAPGGGPSSEPGRRALRLVGIGVLIVGALYGVTLIAGDDPREAPVTPDGPAAVLGSGTPAAPPAAGGAPPELDPAAVAALPLPDDLRADAEAAAAVVTGAQQAGTAAAWDDAGRLYLDLARRAGPDARPTLARQAIAAFQRSLAVEDSPDVRTRMVSAYRYDPATTMQPVMELQRVLADRPGHPEANFQMGELRLQIGRADSAAASFARAAAGAPPGSTLRRDAQMMLEQARQQAATAPAPSPLPAAPPPVGG